MVKFAFDLICFALIGIGVLFVGCGVCLGFWICVRSGLFALFVCWFWVFC